MFNHLQTRVDDWHYWCDRFGVDPLDALVGAAPCKAPAREIQSYLRGYADAKNIVLVEELVSAFGLIRKVRSLPPGK